VKWQERRNHSDHHWGEAARGGRAQNSSPNPTANFAGAWRGAREVRKLIFSCLAAAALSVGVGAQNAQADNTTVPPPPSQAARAAVAITAARSVLGTPYVWGGNGPPSGFDCSGLTKWSWGKAGVTIPRTANAQYVALPKVWYINRHVGDLIAYGNPVHHITLYIGNNKMIAAPHTGTVVQIQTLYWTGYRGMVRPGL
jgi:cell wall-associated NlpC family hydrolase